MSLRQSAQRPAWCSSPHASGIVKPESTLDHRTQQNLLREDFGALFRATYGELCGFVLDYVGSRAIAEELVQDVFVRLWDRRASLLEDLPSRTYLYRSARNRALDHIKHERVVQRVAREYPPQDDERLAPAVDAELDARI